MQGRPQPAAVFRSAPPLGRGNGTAYGALAHVKKKPQQSLRSGTSRQSADRLVQPCAEQRRHRRHGASCSARPAGVGAAHPRQRRRAEEPPRVELQFAVAGTGGVQLEGSGKAKS